MKRHQNFKHPRSLGQVESELRIYIWFQNNCNMIRILILRPLTLTSALLLTSFLCVLCSIASAQTFNNPVVERTTENSVKIEKIIIEDEFTRVFFNFINLTNAETFVWLEDSSSKNAFYLLAEDVRYNLREFNGVGSRSNPSKIYPHQNLTFYADFEPIPNYTNKIDIFEGDSGSWHFYNVSLKEPKDDILTDNYSLDDFGFLHEKGETNQDAKTQYIDEARYFYAKQVYDTAIFCYKAANEYSESRDDFAPYDILIYSLCLIENRNYKKANELLAISLSKAANTGFTSGKNYVNKREYVSMGAFFSFQLNKEKYFDTFIRCKYILSDYFGIIALYHKNYAYIDKRIELLGNVAGAFANVGKIDVAIKLIKKNVEYKKNKGLIFRLGEIYLLKQNREAACAYFSKAAEMGYEKAYDSINEYCK